MARAGPQSVEELLRDPEDMVATVFACERRRKNHLKRPSFASPNAWTTCPAVAWLGL